MLVDSVLKNFNDKLGKMGIEVEEGGGEPPRFWTGSGNHVLNLILTGNPYHFLPQGRITGIAGPSGSGKSFIMSNAAKAAQDEGAFVLLLDSENASDTEYMTKIGVDVKNNYQRVQVATLTETNSVLSTFFGEYEKAYGRSKDAPKAVVLIDSLDMLMTENEFADFSKGEITADQGLRAKQMKAILRSCVQNIKHLNIAMAVAIQPYQSKREQILQGEGTWMINNAIRFAFSHIVLLTKLRLREKASKEVMGITMRCQGFKTRFTKPFQTASIEVPYDTGMDPYSGLLSVLESQEIVSRKGSWYEMSDGTKFQASGFDKHAAGLLQVLASGTGYLTMNEDDIEEDTSSAAMSDTDIQKQRVKRKMKTKKEETEE